MDRKLLIDRRRRHFGGLNKGRYYGKTNAVETDVFEGQLLIFRPVGIAVIVGVVHFKKQAERSAFIGLVLQVMFYQQRQF